MDRHIVCVEVPSLEIALARQTDPSLRHKPLGIVASTGSQTALLEVSDEACSDGVQPGVPLDHARRCCPALQVLIHDRRRLQQGDALLQAAVSQYAPIWEPIRPGHLYLDLTGTTRLFGRAVDTAVRLQRDIQRRNGLTGVLGVASNKLVSRVAASMVRPAEVCDVQMGSESAFVAPMLLTGLPVLDGPHAKRALDTLYDLNLHMLSDLAPIPIPHLEVAVGPLADLLHAWSHGIDPSPVWPITAQPILEVSAAVEPAAIDDATVWGSAAGLMEQVCRTLRQQQRVCRRIRLTLQHTDGLDVSNQHAMPEGTYWEMDLQPVVQRLCLRTFQRRVRVKRITVRAEALGPPDRQTALFPAQDELARTQRQRLAVAMDRLRDRFGDQSVWWGRTRPGGNAQFS